MDLLRTATRYSRSAGLCLALALTCAHAEMVSIAGSTVNMRSAPGTDSTILWELERGYPLQVLGRKGSWLQVRDFENDKGWVARSLTGKTPHHIVKAKVANIRSGPGPQHRIVGRAERYDVMRTRGSQAGWVRVERGDGIRGWIARHLLWGW